MARSLAPLACRDLPRPPRRAGARRRWSRNSGLAAALLALNEQIPDNSTIKVRIRRVSDAAGGNNRLCRTLCCWRRHGDRNTAALTLSIWILPSALQNALAPKAKSSAPCFAPPKMKPKRLLREKSVLLASIGRLTAL